MRNLVFLFIVSLGLNLTILGQLHLPPSISQYMFNPMSSNPGYAGFYDMTIGSNLFRSQANNTEANFSNTLNVHTSLPLDNLGAGININYDRLGISTSLNIDLALSYKINFGDNKLSFGAQGTFFNAKNNFDRLKFGSETHRDQFTPEGPNSFNKPNFGLGVMYSGRKFFGGISAPRLLTISQEVSNVYTVDNNTVESTRTSRFSPYYTVSAGTIIGAKDLLEMKPSFMLKYIESTGMLLDINYSVLFKQSIWAGVSVRNAIQAPEESGSRLLEKINSIGLMAQVQATDKIKAGFSYELPVNKELIRASNGYRNPFELMISYNIAVFEEQGVHTFLY